MDARSAHGVQVGQGNFQLNIHGDVGLRVEHSDPSSSGPIMAIPPLTGREVRRDYLMSKIVELLSAGVRTVRMTTTLRGAGGFGKTTMARLAAHDPVVRQLFQDGIVWVTLGDGVLGADLADKIDDLCSLFSGRKPRFADPHLAGAELARLLGNKKILLIIDDVWERQQLDPFLQAGPNVVRLLTSRLQSVAPAESSAVDVDAMILDEAEAVLLAGLDAVPSHLARQLLERTGQWPVLLSLINGALRADLRSGADVVVALTEVLEALAQVGPTALDLTNSLRREEAVEATMSVSLGRLSTEEQQRFAELAVFPEDIEIPRLLLERWWRESGNWLPSTTRRFCRKLADASLVSEYRQDSDFPRLLLHDVVRDYLRHKFSPELPRLHGELIASQRVLVPTTEDGPNWWELPSDERYLWNLLPFHLAEARHKQALTALLSDPRFILGKLAVSGPAMLEADLSLSDDKTCRSLQLVIRQDGHLLTQSAAPKVLALTLAARLFGNPDVGEVLSKLLKSLSGPRLLPLAPLPDLPHRRLLRSLVGHAGDINALVVAPNATWLASASEDGSVRVWDSRTGVCLLQLVDDFPGPEPQPVRLLAVAPDSSWLASANWDGVLRIWEIPTGRLQHRLHGTMPDLRSSVVALASSPAGEWLASIESGTPVDPWAPTRSKTTIALWDPRRGSLLREGTVCPGSQLDAGSTLLVAPDGTWLAWQDDIGRIYSWDAPSLTRLFESPGHRVHSFDFEFRSRPRPAMANTGDWLAAPGLQFAEIRILHPRSGDLLRSMSSPSDRSDEYRHELLATPSDGSWLASSGRSQEVDLWEPHSGVHRGQVHVANGPVHALAADPRGTWLAADSARTIPIWDMPSGESRHILNGHTGQVTCLEAAPDGGWLASGGRDHVVRIWDTAGPTTESTEHHTGWVRGLAVAADGSLLASAGDDGSARIWDPVTGRQMHKLLDEEGLDGAAFLPDASLLAAVAHDGRVILIDPVEGTRRRTLVPSKSRRPRYVQRRRQDCVVAVSPDGSWIASSDMQRTINVWKVETGELWQSLEVASEGVRSMEVSPDGSRLWAAGDGNKIRTWDPLTGRYLRSLRRPKPGRKAAALGPLAMDPFGRWLAAAGDDGALVFWNPSANTDAYIGTIAAHPGRIRGLVVAPGGAWLASAGDDGEVHVWNPNTGERLATLPRHDGRALGLAASAEGGYLASGGDDGVLRVSLAGTGEPVTAVRVDAFISSIIWSDNRLYAAGERGPYPFRFLHES